MPWLETCNKAYAAVNVAGRINDALTADKSWYQAAVREEVARQLSHFDAAPPPQPERPVRDLLASQSVQFKYRVAVGLQGHRLIAPFLVYALPTVRPNSYAPLAELAFGRGQSTPLGKPLILSGVEHIHSSLHLYDGVTQTGILGLLLEAVPLALASRCRRRDAPNAAAACTVAATIGRVLLQPPRLVAAGAMLATVVAFATVLGAVELALQGVGIAGAALYLPWAPRFGSNTFLHRAGRGVLDAVDSLRISLPLEVDACDRVIYGDGVEILTHRLPSVRAALKAFNEQSGLTTPEAVAQADAIAEACARLPGGVSDPDLLRRCLAPLEAYMAVQYPEAQWQALAHAGRVGPVQEPIALGRRVDVRNLA